MNWQLQEAKNRLSEVVKRVNTKGLQVITMRGQVTRVLISAERYKKMAGSTQTLSEYLGNSPLKGLQLKQRNPRDAEYRDMGH